MRARAIPVETTNININVDAHVDLLPARESEKKNDVYTYSHETRRTPRKNPILIVDLGLPPRGHAASTTAAGRSSCAGEGAQAAGAAQARAAGAGALDVVVEALDDVAGGGLFEVGLLEAVDLVLELGLSSRKHLSAW